MTRSSIPMMNLKPRIWWLMLALLLAVTGGVGWLLAAQGYQVLGRAIWWAGGIIAAAWIVVALIRWQDHPWVRRTTVFVLGTLLAAVVGLLCLTLGARGYAIATLGVWSMAVLFFVGLMLVRLVLTPGTPILGVAHTLVDEAIRMKVPLIFIIALVLLVPVLPFVLDPQELLKYRIQSFLTYAMTAISVLLALMTIFLAVGTITNELQYRQIFLTMTKPVSRGRYLLGKWLGIVLLDLVLVAVSGAGVYVFTMLLARQPAASREDRVAVNEQILVARREVTPSPVNNADLQAQFRDRLKRLRQNEPGKYGQVGDPVSDLSAGLIQQIQKQVVASWYVLPPLGSKSYRFTNLGGVKTQGPTLQLRLKPEAAAPTSNGLVYLVLRINGHTIPQRQEMVAGQYGVIQLPSTLINKQGVLKVDVANIPIPDATQPGKMKKQPSISFNTSDGIELLYKVGGFTPNLTRGLFIMWVKLACLAMLGLMAGTYLGFPVACLLALLVYIAGAASGYVGKSLQFYAAFPHQHLSAWEHVLWYPRELWTTAVEHGNGWKSFKIIIRLVGATFMAMIPRFGDYGATNLVAGGRLVSWRMLSQATFWIGLWTAGMAFIAWLIFRCRELARVTV